MNDLKQDARTWAWFVANRLHRRKLPRGAAPWPFATFVWFICVVWAPGSFAQMYPGNNLYGQYQGYGSFGSNGGYGSGGAYGSNSSYGYSGDGSGSQTSMGGATSGTGSQAGANSAFNPIGTYGQANGPSGFSPLTIPQTSAPGLDFQQPLQPFTGSSSDGHIPAPVYALPGEKPGQFELFKQPPPAPGEFESYVEKTLGQRLSRFGETLILNGSKGFVRPVTAAVPPSYILNPGDELRIGVTGTVEADLTLTVDSEGRIFIPRIGPVNLAGVRYGDLAAAITRRLNDQYKKVNVSAVIARLHGLTVYVTGYAVSPGAYTVSSLSTMVNAVLAAGGPASGGSFRTIELRRNGVLVSKLDLYDLLINGDKSHDVVLENEDVLDIRPAGPEVAITGSVQQEAIYESKPGETLGDVIAFAGGLNSLADHSRIVVSRLSDLDRKGSQELSLAEASHTLVEAGEIIRVLSLANVARAQERQAILATIDGEVDHPGRYYLPPGSTLADLLRAAGGETSGAFLYGSELDRISVKRQQASDVQRVIQDLRLTAAAVPLTQAFGFSATVGSTNVGEQSGAVGQGIQLLITSLTNEEPDGRLVLPIAFDTPVLPLTLGLENLDHFYIPPVPKYVAIYGAVYQTGSFLFTPGQRIGDYLSRAGGPRKNISDPGAIFIIRANGAVVSRTRIHNILRQNAQPGDVIFVPLRSGPTLFDRIIQASQFIFQAGTGLSTTLLTLDALGLKL